MHFSILLCTNLLEIYLHISADHNTSTIYITEGFISNVFVITKNGEIMTCPDNHVLPGCMSKIVKLLCRHHNIPMIDKKMIDMNDLLNWDAMFITNSVKRIVNVDGIVIDDMILKQLDDHVKEKLLMMRDSTNEVIIDDISTLSKSCGDGDRSVDNSCNNESSSDENDHKRNIYYFKNHCQQQHDQIIHQLQKAIDIYHNKYSDYDVMIKHLEGTLYWVIFF